MVWISGQQLQGGKYVIEQVLGEGGFGVTYKARHTMLNAFVVIKTPNESLRNDPEYPKFIKRFREEGERLEKLSQTQHPNIVRVRDLFHENGTYCLVMDFVQGDSLFNLIQKRNALPTQEAVKYITQIGEALKVVHQAGLVHRDAHPGNIMVQQDGKAVLIDFGIAGEIIPKTVSSKVFANPAFAPYEQMRGDRKPCLDIYSLAASLYYAVTGKLPEAAINRRLYGMALVSPQEHNSSIGDRINQAILKGMELEPENRPQNMQEWLELLKEPVRKATPKPDLYSEVLEAASGSSSSGHASQQRTPVKNSQSKSKQIQQPTSSSSVGSRKTLKESLSESWWNLAIVFANFSLIGFISDPDIGLNIALIWILVIIVPALANYVPFRDKLFRDKHDVDGHDFYMYAVVGGISAFSFIFSPYIRFPIGDILKGFNLPPKAFSSALIILFMIGCLLCVYWNLILFFKLWDEVEHIPFKSRASLCFFWAIICLLGLGLGAYIS